jgi:hypothetical protein
MPTESVREFFESLETRAQGSAKAAGLNATYLFDIDGAGKWLVRVENGPAHAARGDEQREGDHPRHQSFANMRFTCEKVDARAVATGAPGGRGPEDRSFQL